MPSWLVELGVALPQPAVIDAQLGYATRTYRGSPSELDSCHGIAVAATPETLEGGLALRVENGQWLVSGVGFGAHRPPRDNDGFEAFLRRLADPALAELVAQSEPVDDVRVHRQTANVRHFYERVSRWPAGLLVVGDALCAFDPVYGQGITVAASQGVVLRHALPDGRQLRHSGRPLRHNGRLQRRLAACVAVPWAIATSEDLRFPTSEGRQSVDQVVLGAWARELGRLAVHQDVRAADLMGRVYNLLASPVVLAHPTLIWSAVRARLRGYGPESTRPEPLEALSRRVTGSRQAVGVQLGGTQAGTTAPR